MTMLVRHSKGRVNRGTFKITVGGSSGITGYVRESDGLAGFWGFADSNQHWNGIRLLSIITDATGGPVQTTVQFQQPPFWEAGGTGKSAGSTKFNKLTIVENSQSLLFSNATITISDPGNGNGAVWKAVWSSGGILLSPGSVRTIVLQDDNGTITVGNQPPANIVPGPQGVLKNTNLVFSGAQGNLISVSDDSASVTATVSVSTGTVTLTTGGGATITSNGTSSASAAGTVAQVNAALAGLTYTPVTNATGSVTLTISTTDGQYTVNNTVSISVNATAASQADTIQTPLVRHPVDWLRTGDSYIAVDGRWGWASSNPSVDPDLTEGTASYNFFQYMSVSLHDSPDNSGGVRWHLYWPQFNSLGHAVDFNNNYSEVKTFPSLCIGPKPGYFGTGIYPAFSFIVKDKSGQPYSVPPQFTPTPIVNDWQNAGGAPVLDSPSGGTYGDGLKLPLKLPLTNQTCLIRGRYKEYMTPTGRGHLSFDIWQTQTQAQIKGHPQSSLTHEIMIPLRYWGGYGKFGNRNPSWYIKDVTIDGVLYHMYATKDNPKNDVTGVVDGNGAVGYYPGLRYNFGGLDTVNHYTNEETGQDRIGWKLIVFEFDGGAGNPDLAAHPLDSNGYFNLDYSKFVAVLATTLDSRGVPFIQNTEYLQSIELGVESVWGENDIAVYDFKVLPSPNVVTMPALPTYTNTAPTNHVPGSQNVSSGVAFSFGHATGNQIWVVDKDNDRLTVTVSVPAASGTLSVVAGSGATVTGNGTLSVQLVGTPGQVNAALDGMTYTFTGSGTITLTIATSDGVAATATNTVSLVVTSASNAPTLMQTQFTAGNGGIWLENLLADMLDGSSSVPAAWTGTISKWKNHGAANGHDFTETVSTAYPNLGTDAGGKNYVNGYSGNTMASVGGSTTGFYACFVVDWQSYYGTLISDQDVANHGIRLYQSADLGQWVFACGKGTATVTAAVSNGLAQFAQGIGKCVIEAWFDGTNLNIRMNKGTAGTAALGVTTITAGNANMELFANWSNTDTMTGNTYAGVVFKNYVPPSGDRDTIATYFGAKAGLTI
jgi:hypothetical protein